MEMGWEEAMEEEGDVDGEVWRLDVKDIVQSVESKPLKMFAVYLLFRTASGEGTQYISMTA